MSTYFGAEFGPYANYSMDDMLPHTTVREGTMAYILGSPLTRSGIAEHVKSCAIPGIEMGSAIIPARYDWVQKVFQALPEAPELPDTGNPNSLLILLGTRKLAWYNLCLSWRDHWRERPVHGDVLMSMNPLNAPLPDAEGHITIRPELQKLLFKCAQRFLKTYQNEGGIFTMTKYTNKLIDTADAERNLQRELFTSLQPQATYLPQPC